MFVNKKGLMWGSGALPPAAGGIGDLGAKTLALDDFYNFSIKNYVLLGIFGL